MTETSPKPDSSQFFLWKIKRYLHGFYRKVFFHFIQAAEPGIYEMPVLWQSYGVRMGKNVHIDPTCYVDRGFANLLELQDDVVVAMQTSFIMHDSSINNVTGGPMKAGRIIVEAGAYIGAGVMVLPGVRIGRGAIVGAGSLVTKDLEAGMVSAGRPAKALLPVAELHQRFEERARLTSAMACYLDFPSQHQQALLSAEELRWHSEKMGQDIQNWLRQSADSDLCR